MNIFSGLEEIVKTGCDLSNYTWYGLGGKAEYLITPQTVEQLQTVAQRCKENSLPVRVLGLGSNLLVGDEGVKGVVVKLEGEQFTQTEFDGTTITAWAGANLGKLVLECVRRGLGGMEALAGVPGTIGGAVKMNAGGNYGDIGASIQSVTLMDSEGNLFDKAKPELIFDYRSVNITAPFIVNAKLELIESDPEHLLKTIKEIWIYKKNSQPLNTKNAGCVFKNPRGVSAGALIDRAGLKGLQMGGAQVSEKHANFIITHEECKSADVKRLIDSIKDRVKEEFDVALELELEIW